ncbi:unnamed protein product [Protopolystoma xenopodis]|uniref:Uncharacterized protein n=1 Tax=Protopolystoma xenopodis TaxID=117903 RepID=A0A3S5FGW8_9PLAT|nr:unnamed protein product [Protopolystoma xenopodis]
MHFEIVFLNVNVIIEEREDKLSRSHHVRGDSKPASSEVSCLMTSQLGGAISAGSRSSTPRLYSLLTLGPESTKKEENNRLSLLVCRQRIVEAGGIGVLRRPGVHQRGNGLTPTSKTSELSRWVKSYWIR